MCVDSLILHARPGPRSVSDCLAFFWGGGGGGAVLHFETSYYLCTETFQIKDSEEGRKEEENVYMANGSSGSNIKQLKELLQRIQAPL